MEMTLEQQQALARARARARLAASSEPDPNAPPPSWAQARQQVGPAAMKQGGEWLDKTADFISSLPNDPLGYKIGRGVKAVGGALYDAAKDELGSDLQYIRNLSPQQFRGSAPAMAGGEREHHPLLALTQGDTQPYNEAAKTDPALALTQGNVDPAIAWAKKGKWTGPLVGDTSEMRRAMATAPLGIAADVLSTVGPTRPGRMALEATAEAAAAAARAPAAAVRATRRAATRGFTPEPLPIQDARLVREYERMGGRLRPGQYSPSTFMRVGDETLADTPFPRAAGFQANSEHAIRPDVQSDEFHRFLSQTFGENSPRLTDDVIQNAHERIGNVYDTVLPRNAIRESTSLNQAFANIETRLANNAEALKPEDLTRVGGVINKFKRLLTQGEGTIPGDLYHAFRQRGGILDELENDASPTVSDAGRRLRNALDAAFAAQARGGDARALQQANEQYRALLTLKPLAAKAPAGKISPGLLMNQVIKEYDSPGNAGRLGTLARVGGAYMKPLANSLTAPRSLWYKMLNEPLKVPGHAAARTIQLPMSAVAGRLSNRLINAPDARQRLLARALEEEAAAAAAGAQGATNMPQGPSAAVLAQVLRQMSQP